MHGNDQANSGDLLIYPAGTLHNWSSELDGSLQIFLLQWTGWSPSGHAALIHDHDARMVTLFEWIFDLEISRTERPQPLFKRLIDVLLDAIKDALPGTHDVGADPVRWLASYLRNHLRHNISLNDCCRLTGLRPSQLTQRFRTVFGAPPIRYLKQIRIETAHRLLISTRQPVGEITRNTGFSSASRLAREIKIVYGKSPSQLRDGG